MLFASLVLARLTVLGIVVSWIAALFVYSWGRVVSNTDTLVRRGRQRADAEDDEDDDSEVDE